MKIEFEWVEYNNFLSTGYNTIRIDLNKNKTVLIIGQNGSGKSTILDVLCFCLFNKAFRNINKGDLINSINGKELLTKCQFSKGGNTYRVVRGMKPNIFEIYVNDVLLEQMVDGEYQQKLEDILGMNIKTFKQVVVIGNAAYIPFMQQDAKTRREMVEDLLDIKVFSHMNVLLKDRLNSCKTSIQEVDMKIQYAKQSLEFVKKISETYEEDVGHQIMVADNDIMILEAEIETLGKEKNDLKRQADVLLTKTIKKSKYEENLKKISDKEREVETIITLLKKELKFFGEHQNCPTCKQDISLDHKNQIMNQKMIDIDIQEEIETKLEVVFVENQNKLKEINKILDDYNVIMKKIAIINDNISYKQKDVRLLKTKIIELKEKKVEEKTDFEKMKNDYDIAIQEREKLTKDKETLEFVGELLKDGGIKSQIIKKHIPVINKLINKYLASMDFFVNFELDEQFNETIKSRYRDKFKYANFSEGEKMRLDLAILFAWRAVAKTRNSIHTNILFLDEVFESSLDSNGTDEFLKIINDLTDGTNTFIISHKGDQLFDKFEKTLKFEKHQSFSRMI